MLFLIVRLIREFEYISYTKYYKSKTTTKSLIPDHTLIYVIKPSCFSTKIFNLILTIL